MAKAGRNSGERSGSGARRSSAGSARPPTEVEIKPGAAPGCSPARILTFADAMDYLSARINLERDMRSRLARDEYKLDRMRAIARAMGDPQDSVRTVHVAGTKGKGSTCEMVATCLEHCGYTVGLYTSPHIVDIRERVRLNRRPISEADFTASIAAAARAADDLEPSFGPATFFELLTAAGFSHFAQQAVDVAVIEVGLGGLLDCTNIITPEVAAVTLIGFDHMEILGDTLEKIAAQKAGIFKPAVPAISFDQDAGVLRVFKETADRVGCPLSIVGKDIEFNARTEYRQGYGPVTRVNLVTERSRYEHLPVPLHGDHQAKNCALALAVLDKLSERGFKCPEELVSEGMAHVELPGRFELLPTSPRVLLDVAHNPESIRALMKSIGASVTFDSLIVVFGCADDKDSTEILKALALGADKVIFTRSNSPRAADPAALQREYNELSGKMSQVAQSVSEAIDLAARASDRGDLLCITGSFYVVGDAKKHLAAAAERRKAGGNHRPGGR